MPDLQFQKIIPFCKVDAIKREVWAIITAEVLDSDKQICQYSGTVPYYKAFSEKMSKATDGENLLPLRAMHQLVAAGKCIALEYRDEAKQIYGGFKVVDDDEWKKCEECVYTGISQGGRFVKIWKDDTGQEWYIADPVEASLVDVPSLPTATFEFVRADGSTELRKFSDFHKKIDSAVLLKKSPSLGISKKSKTKRVDGEDLPASAFLIIGDEDRTATWKLPVHFSTDAKSEKHIRLAEQLFSTLKDVPEGERKKAKAKLKRLCREFGITMTDETKAKQAEVAKSLYTVSRFAELLQSIRSLESSCTYEGDYEGEDESDYAMAARIHQWLKDGAEILPDMVDEELDELVAAEKAAGGHMTDDLQKKKFNFAATAKKMAAHHETMAEAHKADGESHEEMMEAHKAMKAACGKADVGSNDDMKEFHVASVGFHKAKAANCMKLHKAHMGMAEHFGKMAEGYEAGASAPQGGEAGGQPVGGKEGGKAAGAEEIQKAQQAAVEKAAEALLAKRNADKAAAEAADPMQQLLKAVQGLTAKVDAMENKPVAVPGLTLVPRTVTKATGTDGKTTVVGDDDIGL